MKLPLCYCNRCNLMTAHWYDRVFYAFFCTMCDDNSRNPKKGT